MTNEHACATCGQTTGYYSTVNAGITRMIKAFSKIVEEKGINAVNVKKEMVDTGRMAVTAYHNLSHMTRLGLVAKIDGEPGNYAMTRRAEEYLNGQPIPRFVRVEKKTRLHPSRKVESSEDLAIISEFSDPTELWTGIGYTIHAGRVIRTAPVKSNPEYIKPLV